MPRGVERGSVAPATSEPAEVLRRLREGQGPPAPKPVLPPLDELIATVLSQHTSDRNSEAAFASLKARFPTWQEVLRAPVGEVADAIRRGGIADQKAPRTQPRCDVCVLLAVCPHGRRRLAGP